MRHTPLNDARIQTAAGLRKALQDPKKLQYYVLDGDQRDLQYAEAWRMPEVDQNGDQVCHPRGGKRRIDYIMHRRSDKHVVDTAIFYCFVFAFLLIRGDLRSQWWRSG